VGDHRAAGTAGFPDLAEELHFGRTAERLGLTPSRVSQSLREVEHKLGAQLVHRTSRRVQLTSLGETFLASLAPAHAQLTEVLERTHATTSSLEGTLRLGLFSGPAGGEHLLAIIGAYEAAYPGSKVDVMQVSWDDPFAQLRNGDVDLMASWLPLEQPDLVIGPTLSRHSRVLAVPHDNPLAGRAQTSVEDLVDQRIARFGGWPSELEEAWVPPQTPSGRPIPGARIQVGERTALGIAVRVARGELVHLTVAAAGPSVGSLDLAYVPVTGLPTLRSGLVWRRRRNDPKLREFVRIARDVLRATTVEDSCSSER
jgi:DNA-binding transcriptional LysR family regulator